MLEAKHSTRPTPYASRADFGRIFTEEMDDLYLLSLLLTADCEKAEQCFVSGLGDSVEGNPVFKEWARSWARRTIIQNAVKVIHPRPEASGRSTSALVNCDGKTLPLERVEVAAILGLKPFERFVYVMSALERYSEQDCCVLLDCARRDVTVARARALQQVGSAMQSREKQRPDARSEKPVLHEGCSSGLQFFDASSSVTSASANTLSEPWPSTK
jgi:DNA-directed RNA polymerase specialized sigma24 family protein